MNVVLVALSSTAPGQSVHTSVEALRQSGVAVHLVSRTPPAPDLASALNGYTSVGRPVSPWHLPGRLHKIRIEPNRLVDAIALQRRRGARELLAAADVIVALDATAVPAVWLAARRGPDAVALNGMPAAMTHLSRRGGRGMTAAGGADVGR
jgi:hypothetical protein